MSTISYYRTWTLRLAGLLLFFSLAGCGHPENPIVESAPSLGAAYQRLGVMSVGEYERIARLEDAAANGRALSGANADWLLSVADRPGTVVQKGLRRRAVDMVFRVSHPGDLPSSRAEPLFHYATGLLQEKYPAGGSFQEKDFEEINTMDACIILDHLKNPAAIPFLTPQLASPYISVHKAARYAIRDLSRTSQHTTENA